MRPSTRAAATALTALVITAGGLVAAVPAAADPGEGCAGLPEMPAAYVCVVRLRPSEGLPGVEPSPLPVRVPPVCYVAGCTQPTVVNVPVPTTTEPEGYVAVLSYQGTEYPIGIGLDAIWPLVEEVQVLAGNAVGLVTGAVDDLPSAGEILLAVHDIVDPIVADQTEEVEQRIEQVNNVIERLPEILETLRDRINDLIRERPVEIELAEIVQTVRDALDDEYCLC